MQCHNDVRFPGLYRVVCGFEEGKRVVIEHAANVFIELSIVNSNSWLLQIGLYFLSF